MSALDNAHIFWKDFSKQEKEIRQALDEKRYDDCIEMVKDLDDFAYESFGCHFFVDNAYQDYELTWDTGPNKTTQYLAQMVCDQAPPEIKKGWILQSCLPPLSQKAIQAQVQIKDSVYALPDFLLFYEANDAQQMWDCKLYCPGFSLIKNPENKREMSIYLLEMALGQCAYEAYVSNVDFLDEPDAKGKFCNLVDAYDKLMDDVENKKWKTYRSPLEIYSVYQPIQEIADDALGKDMKFLFTTHPLLTEDTINKTNDVQKDLEVKGGEFGMVYYSNLFGTREDALFRQELTQQLDQALSPYARSVAGAIGKSFSYIHLIVFDRKGFLKMFERVQKKLEDKVKLFYQKF